MEFPKARFQISSMDFNYSKGLLETSYYQGRTFINQQENKIDSFNKKRLAISRGKYTHSHTSKGRGIVKTKQNKKNETKVKAIQEVKK